MSKDHKCFRKMMKVATTPQSQEGYAYKIQKFMRYCVLEKTVDDNEDFEKLLEFDSDKITDLLNDYVDWQINKGDKHNTISSALVAPEALFEMNRKAWFKKEPKGVHYDEKSETLFVTHPDAETVSIIDTKTSKMIFNLKIASPSKILVNSNENMAYVLSREFSFGVEGPAEEFDSLQSINLKSMKITNKFPTKNRVVDFLWGQYPGYNNFALNSKINRVYFTNQQKNILYTLDKNLKILEKTKIPKIMNPSIAVNCTTNRIYLASSGKLKNWLYVIEDK